MRRVPSPQGGDPILPDLRKPIYRCVGSRSRISFGTEHPGEVHGKGVGEDRRGGSRHRTEAIRIGQVRFEVLLLRKPEPAPRPPGTGRRVYDFRHPGNRNTDHGENRRVVPGFPVYGRTVLRMAPLRLEGGLRALLPGTGGIPPGSHEGTFPQPRLVEAEQGILSPPACLKNRQRVLSARQAWRTEYIPQPCQQEFRKICGKFRKTIKFSASCCFSYNLEND